MVTLKASSQGALRIKQARKAKGWAVDDFRWLEEASKLLGIAWEEKGYLAYGISEGTWKRFLSGKYAINADAFQAFCQVLGLKWQEIVERHGRQDWGEAIDVSCFCGRTAELNLLKEWIVEDRCRLITLLGMGGIGKTALATKIAHLLKNQFDFIIWRSLRYAPSLEELLVDLIQFLSKGKATNLSSSLEQKIALCRQYLCSSRCLLILDNVESILQSGASVGHSFISRMGVYRAGYETYSQLFYAIAQTQHQSCLLLTSQEKPQELSSLEGNHLPVHSLQLKGLPTAVGREILQTKGSFVGSQTEWQKLIELCGGNPLILKLVAVKIEAYFQGNITDFLAISPQGVFIFEDVCSLLQQQWQRLTLLEKQIMYWLSIERQPVKLQDLQQNFFIKVANDQLIQSLASLQRRSLIQRNGDFFSQPTLVMEYIIHKSKSKIILYEKQLISA